MNITQKHIRDTTVQYAQAHPEERPALARLLELLDQDAPVTSRKEFRGHVTAGAVLVDRTGNVLFIHHNATGRWLTPGGHLEAEDENLMGAALRELVEETGIRAGIAPVGTTPIHIDVHPIDANEAKAEPGHQHFDFRYLFRTEDSAVPVGDLELQAEEVSGCAWRSVDALSDERLRGRVSAMLG
ncbi:NUDIX hydrolase [Streptomyces sp. NPDC101062]|uniref:NUDIX hydrolase n=1 Tax=unclassified Streptomyces TaxID=2593676 RepID=UPI00382627A9